MTNISKIYVKIIRISVLCVEYDMLTRPFGNTWSHWSVWYVGVHIFRSFVSYIESCSDTVISDIVVDVSRSDGTCGAVVVNWSDIFKNNFVIHDRYVVLMVISVYFPFCSQLTLCCRVWFLCCHRIYGDLVVDTRRYESIASGSAVVNGSDVA